MYQPSEIIEEKSLCDAFLEALKRNDVAELENIFPHLIHELDGIINAENKEGLDQRKLFDSLFMRSDRSDQDQEYYASLSPQALAYIFRLLDWLEGVLPQILEREYIRRQNMADAEHRSYTHEAKEQFHKEVWDEQIEKKYTFLYNVFLHGNVQTINYLFEHPFSNGIPKDVKEILENVLETLTYNYIQEKNAAHPQIDFELLQRIASIASRLPEKAQELLVRAGDDHLLCDALGQSSPVPKEILQLRRNMQTLLENEERLILILNGSYPCCRFSAKIGDIIRNDIREWINEMIQALVNIQSNPNSHLSEEIKQQLAPEVCPCFFQRLLLAGVKQPGPGCETNIESITAIIDALYRVMQVAFIPPITCETRAFWEAAGRRSMQAEAEAVEVCENNEPTAQPTSPPCLMELAHLPEHPVPHCDFFFSCYDQ